MKNRSVGSRGGVVNVTISLSYIRCDDLAINVENKFESIFIKIKDTKPSIIVGEIYRATNTSEKQSIERFHKITNNLKSKISMLLQVLKFLFT